MHNKKSFSAHHKEIKYTNSGLGPNLWLRELRNMELKIIREYT